jgi:hypothetical protein
MVALRPWQDSHVLTNGTAILLVRHTDPAIPVSAGVRSAHEAMVRAEETFHGVADHHRHMARSARPTAHVVMFLDWDQPPRFFSRITP